MEDAIPIPMQPTLCERMFVRPVSPSVLWARWIFLRGLGAIFFSAFLSLAWTIHGLIGPNGISPARDLLADLSERLPLVERVWRVPTILWLGAGDGALTTLVTIGLVSSVLILVNVAPRAMIATAGLAFLSFIAAAQEFSMYQSDGMLLEAAFASFFFAPRGLRPRLGEACPPTHAPLFLLRWEWFRIYFESGIVKIQSGDPQWAGFTAMDHYYENGPLPTWIGWYVQHLPHGFHAATVWLTFAMELGVVLLAWMGRRARLLCFALVTPFQIGIILTANYAFLNYLVLMLGLLLLDDGHFARVGLKTPVSSPAPTPRWRTYASAMALSWIFYGTVLTGLHVPGDSPLAFPVLAIQPFRIANAYGLFAIMTKARYEIEFQATTDGTTWVPYRFRYKPQDVNEAPGIYAPYQPRFEWNLWFASLGWTPEQWVIETELRLMQREPASSPFSAMTPSTASLPSGSVPSSGNTGSPPWTSTITPAPGGPASLSPSTSRPLNAALTARSRPSAEQPSHIGHWPVLP